MSVLFSLKRYATQQMVFKNYGMYWCFTPLSALFSLSILRRTVVLVEVTVGPEETTDHQQVTVKLSHIPVLQSSPSQHRIQAKWWEAIMQSVHNELKCWLLGRHGPPIEELDHKVTRAPPCGAKYARRQSYKVNRVSFEIPLLAQDCSWHIF